jgi:2-dehydropantoate 2-reductase
VVAVLGVGGVGGVVAARTGALCVGTERTVAAIRVHGLRLELDGVRTPFRLDASERLDRHVELLVVAVKAPALGAALERVTPGAVAGAVVLPLLNGLEHVATLRERLPGAAVVAGSIAGLEAHAQEPGLIVVRAATPVITVASDTLPRERLEAALTQLRVPGVDVVVGSSESAVLWAKAARMAVLAPATAASSLAVGALRSDATWAGRLREALAEACAVAAAEGVPLDPATEWNVIASLPGSLTTSAARDVEARRSDELDAIAGAVVRTADRHRIAVPALAGLLAEARARAARG